MSSPGQVQLELYLRETDAALKARDTVRALRIADEATSRGLEHPNLLTLAAHRRMHAGDAQSALTLLVRARQLSPRSVDVLNALGLCLVQLNRAREALAVYDAALRVAPATPVLHFHKGQAYERLSELDRARREYESTLELAPKHHEALASLATLALQRGDNKAARDYAARALALAPGMGAANLVLASVEIAEKNFTGAAARLQPLLAGQALGPVNRAFAQSLMGDVFDGQDKTGDAFAAYAASKAMLRDIFAPSLATVENSAARARRLTDYFRNADDTVWRASRTATPQPRVHAFLVGFPRSGTTLLEQVLASHPGVEAMEERDALGGAIAEYIGSEGGLDRLAQLSPQDAARWREAYWKIAGEFGHAADKPVFLDKMPLNTVVLPLIAKLFPDAKIIFALRDPRDVVLSCFRRRFGMSAQMFELTSLDGAAAYYDAVMELAEIYREKLGLDLTQTRHEDLLADFDGETKRLCEFLGIDWREDMKNFAARAQRTNIDTPSSAQVGRGLTREGAGQWRRYKDELASVLPTLAPWAERFGYPEN